MKTSTLRLKSVRMKDGGAELRVFRPDLKMRDVVERDFAAVMRGHTGAVAGYAVVVWGADGSSTAGLRVGENSQIPSIMVPDFVRNRLLASRIESWTIESLMPPKPKGRA